MRRAKANSNTILIVIIVVLVLAGVGVMGWIQTRGIGRDLSEDFVYQTQDIENQSSRQVPVLYEEHTSIPTGFNQSISLAIDQDDLIYAAGDSSITVFNSIGENVNRIDLNAEASCIAVGDEKIFIAFTDAVSVYQNGQLSKPVIVLDEKTVITNMVVEGKDLYVADAGNKVVYHYDVQGNLNNRLAEKNEQRQIPGLVIPSGCFDIAMASDGLLRVVNPGRHRIEAYTPRGYLELSWGEYGNAPENFCGCCNPASIAMLADDSYVTAEKGIPRVKIYNPTGEFVGMVAGTEQIKQGGLSDIGTRNPRNFNPPYDLAVDSNGRIYLLDTKQNAIRVFVKKQIEDAK